MATVAETLPLLLKGGTRSVGGGRCAARESQGTSTSGGRGPWHYCHLSFSVLHLPGLPFKTLSGRYRHVLMFIDRTHTTAVVPVRNASSASIRMRRSFQACERHLFLRYTLPPSVAAEKSIDYRTICGSGNQPGPGPLTQHVSQSCNHGVCRGRQHLKSGPA